MHRRIHNHSRIWSGTHATKPWALMRLGHGQPAGLNTYSQQLIINIPRQD
jgi:hypothetical protein